MKKKGFTLIELLAVILILGIIALIAIPVVSKILKTTKVNANKVTVKNIINGAEFYYNESMLNKNTQFNTDVYDLLRIKNKPENGMAYVNQKGEVLVSIIIDGKCYVKNYTDDDINIYNEDDDRCTAFLVDDTIPIEAKKEQQFIKIGTDSSILSYFTYGNINESKSKCIDTSDENREIVNTSTLSAGSHDISCSIKKVGGAVVDVNTKISVLDYGTAISTTYTNIYVGTTSGNLLSNSSSYLYSGNYSNIWGVRDNFGYLFGAVEKKLSYERTHDYANVTHTQDYIYSGDNSYPLETESDPGKWICIYLHFNWWTGSMAVGNLRITFDDGNTYSVSDAVNNGYIEPLVLAASVSERTNGLMNSFYNILSGSTTSSGSYAMGVVVFKLTENHKMTGMKLYAANDASQTYGDGLYVFQRSDLNISLQSW